MANELPSGWEDASALSGIMGSGFGDVPIKTRIRYSGKTFVLVTDKSGAYKVFEDVTELNANSLVLDKPKDSNADPGGAFSREDLKTSIGGNAGLTGLFEQSRSTVARAFGTYLTDQEASAIQDPRLRELRRVEVNPSENQPQPVNLEDIDFGVTAEDFAAGGAGAYSENQSSLKYPETLNSKQDRIIITQKRYSTKGSTSFIPNFPQNQTQTNSSEVILGNVILPMPNNLTESNATGWGENSLSTVAGTIFGAAISAAQRIADPINPNQTGIRAEGEALTSAGFKEAVKKSLTLNAAAAITKFVGINVDPEAFRARATGTVINPNLQLLFNGPKLRSFGFEFKMTPRTENEAKSIRYIIKFFKKGMAPVRKLTGDSASSEGFYLGAPNVFDISFKSGDGGENLTSIGKIKTCALQQLNVNYTPEGFYAAYQDAAAKGSQPISVVIQLAFTELEPYYNDEYSSESDIASGVN